MSMLGNGKHLKADVKGKPTKRHAKKNEIKFHENVPNKQLSAISAINAIIMLRMVDAHR